MPEAAFAEAESATAAGPDTSVELDEDAEAEAEAARRTVEGRASAPPPRPPSSVPVACQRHERVLRRSELQGGLCKRHALQPRVQRAKRHASL